MPDWKLHDPRGLSVVLLGLMMALVAAPAVHGQSAPPLAAAQFDPSDVYFQGYLAVRAAEELEAAGDFAGSLEQFEKANKLFNAVKTYHPDWKPEMVGGRSAKTQEATARVRPLAEEAMRKNRNVLAELEGGVKKPVTPLDNPPVPAPKADPPNMRVQESPEPAPKPHTPRPPVADPLPPAPSVLEVDPLVTRRLREAETEVERLRSLASRNNGAAQNQIKDLQARLRDAETTVQSLRSRLMAAPVQEEMNALNRRIETLEQEREAMALALNQSRSAHTEAMARIATLEADLNVMRQKHADLQRNLETERNVANSVVAGQRRQLDALEQELTRKNEQLAQANERISGLMNELRESREAFAQLRDERDSLLRERDQMAALLKLNEASRIQDLIEQNMALARNLREANETMERLNRESNADKDAYTDALRDLAIAKSQINRLQQDKREQERRLTELENRLKNEEAALAQGKVSADPAEIEMLRDIIKRQLRVQERRRQARDLLVEAARELGAQDERLAQAIELFDAQEIALSPEELKLVADKQVDGEFVSPFARDRASVSRATSELNRDIAVFERTAEKSFVAGRLLPTRELYQMILEQHPGHTPSLCRLGVVHLRLEEPSAAADAFRRAVELDSNNAYASRMLGFSLMLLGDLPAAEQTVRRAVEISPTDAKSQTLLASLCYRLGRTGEAESHFKAAINADPIPSEPYYNLALICSRDGRLEDARNYYQQALERGALPDPALERKLDQP